MNNITSRFFALLLTLAMVLSLAVPIVPVGAAGTVAPDPVSGVMSWDFLMNPNWRISTCINRRPAVLSFRTVF